MVRIFSTYLLIAVVLACPYQCLGEPECTDKAACHDCTCCCDDSCDSSGDRAPVPPCDSDESCFCQGAIVAGPQSTRDELAQSAPVSWAVDFSLVRVPVVVAAISFESPHPFPPFSTARDLCALACSRQL
jgi:hypothetical protein